MALNSLELAAGLAEGDGTAGEDASAGTTISLSTIERALQKKALVYDKAGEEHYNLISAFHKSLRGSDPDAALYWLYRMIEGAHPICKILV